MLDSVIGVDENLFLLINNGFSRPVLDGVMSFFSTAGDATGWISFGLLAIVMLGGAQAKRRLVLFIVTMVLAGAALHGAKTVFDRDRPLKHFQKALETGEARINAPLGPLYHGSFPSGHSQAAFSTAAFFALYYQRRRALLYSAAALVALSRVYVGVHFPFDVLAGAALGWGVAWIVWKMDTKKSLPAGTESSSREALN